MKKLFIVFLLIASVSACRKARCIVNLKEDIQQDIHFVSVHCTSPGVGNEDFQWKFNSRESYLAYQCTPSNIPFEIGFEGIIIAQGIQVPYVGPLGGDPGYSLAVTLIQDECKKEIDFHFILTTIDTSRVFVHSENVIVVLNGIDSTYKINYSHEIIPYKE